MGEFQGRRWEGRHCDGQGQCARSLREDRECIKINASGKTSSRSRGHEKSGKDHEHTVFTVRRSRQVWDAVE